MPLPEDRSISDVWSALGGELKPSIDVIVSAPFDTRIVVPAAPLVQDRPTLDMLANDAPVERVAARAGSPNGHDPATTGPAATEAPAEQARPAPAKKRARRPPQE